MNQADRVGTSQGEGLVGSSGTAAAAASGGVAPAVERPPSLHEQVLAGLPSAAAIFDPEGRYLFVNALAVPYPERRRWLTGRTPVEAAARWGNAEAAQRFVALMRVAAQERRPLQYEETLKRRSGRVQHVLCTIIPVVGPEGAVTHLVAHGQDLTEHRKAKSALNASQRRLELYREQAPVGFIEWSLDFQVRDWNPAAERIFGYAKAEAVGQRPEDLVGAESLRGRERAVWRALLRHRGGYRTTAEHRRKDGQRIVCEWLNTPVVNADGHIVAVVSIVQDITERLRYEQQLVAAKEEAETAARLKGTIINNISHEIRTPLTAIIGFAEVLAGEVQGEEQREFADLIRRSGRRLMSTLNAMLDLARLESGRMNLSPQPLDLCEAAAESVALFRRQARQKGLVLELVCAAPAVPARLDPGGVHRVLSNLISNAVKFTERGSVLVEVGAGEADVYLRVTDTGPGIGEVFLPRLFEEFKQESEGLARQHEGSGLGLAITKRLVEEMGGAIHVESARGQGSTFTACFPQPECA